LASAESADYMAVQWNYTAKEVLSGLDVADFNSDGLREVVASGSSDGFVYALSDKGAELWTSGCNAIVNTVKAADLDNSGGSEVLAGHSDLYVFSKSGERVWGYNTAEPVYEIAVASIGGDAAKDVVLMTADTKSFNKDSVIYAIDSSKRERLWAYSVKSTEQPLTISAGDVNGDGRDEIAVGTGYRTRDTKSQSYMVKKSSPASVQLVSADGSLLWSFTTSALVMKVLTADLDGDGSVEVIAGSSPTLYVINKDGSLRWKYDPPEIMTFDERSMNDISDVAVADLDGDGKKEVIFGSNKVYVVGSNGSLLWSKTTGSRVYSLATGDVNKDGRPEVIAGAESVYVLSRDGSELWKSSRLTTVGYVISSDLDGDGYDEAVAGAVKSVYVFKTQLRAKLESASNLYDQALAYRRQNNIERALSSANEAKRLYAEAGSSEGVSSCETLIEELNGLSSRFTSLRSEADYYFNLSDHAYVNGDFYNASKYAQTAKEKYSSAQINDREAVGRCDERLRNANSVLQLNATDYLAQAHAKYTAGRLNDSLILAEKAEGIFLLIGYDEGSARSKALIENITAVLGPKKPEQPPFDVSNLTSWVKGRLSGVGVTNVVVALLLIVAVIAVASTLIYVLKNSRKPRLRAERLGRYDFKKAQNAAMQSKVLKKKYRGVGCVLYRCQKK